MTSSLVELHYVIPTSTYPMCDIATVASERDLGESVPGSKKGLRLQSTKRNLGPHSAFPSFFSPRVCLVLSAQAPQSISFCKFSSSGYFLLLALFPGLEFKHNLVICFYEE